MREEKSTVVSCHGSRQQPHLLGSGGGSGPRASHQSAPCKPPSTRLLAAEGTCLARANQDHDRRQFAMRFFLDRLNAWIDYVPIGPTYTQPTIPIFLPAYHMLYPGLTQPLSPCPTVAAVSW